MTTIKITTRTCDACGEQAIVVDDSEHGCSNWPTGWASVEWDEPPEENKTFRQYKDICLCPKHLADLLQMVANIKIVRHAAATEPSVTDLPLSLRRTGARFDSA